MVVVANRPAVPNAGSAEEEALRLVTVAAEALHVKAGNLSSVRLIAMWLLLLALRMWAGGRAAGLEVELRVDESFGKREDQTD